MTLKERLLKNIEITPLGCWEWQLSKRHGYGSIKISNKTFICHRVSYEIFVGKVPKGLLVCHRCDNPSCINPTHLFLGTQRDNTIDMMNKKRHHVIGSPGEKNPNNKLTESQVLQIRKTYSHSKKIYAPALAKKYNITTDAIYYVLKKGWRHIK